MVTDLRALLHDPWLIDQDGVPILESGGTYEQVRQYPCLATRMPEAVPAGMEWVVYPNGADWWIQPDDTVAAMINVEQAELLFIGNAVKVLADALHVDIVIGQPGDDLVQRLATALHALADERDAAKETT